MVAPWMQAIEVLTVCPSAVLWNVFDRALGHTKPLTESKKRYWIAKPSTQLSVNLQFIEIDAAMQAWVAALQYAPRTHPQSAQQLSCVSPGLHFPSPQVGGTEQVFPSQMRPVQQSVVTAQAAAAARH